MNKRGQGVFGMSFGAIFSIIIIIAIIGVAVFTINHFLGLSRCTQVGSFFQEFQDEVDRAWVSGIYRDSFSGSLPGSIEQVCFGDVKTSSGVREDLRSELNRNYFGDGANIFLYPIEKACDGGLFYNKIEHLETSEFFCLDVSNGEVEINLEKDVRDGLVRLR